MRARRTGDIRTRSPPTRIRDCRSEWRSDVYSHRCDTRDDRPSRSLRSLSPPEPESSQRISSKDWRSSSVERRDRPIEGIRYYSGSSPFGQPRNWSQSNGTTSPSMEFQRKYQFAEHADLNGVVNHKLKAFSGYGPSLPRISKEKDFQGNGVSALDGHGMLVQKSMTLEDRTVRTFFTLPPDGHIGENILSSSRNMNMGLVKDRGQYCSNLRPDKFSAGESYKEGRTLYSKGESYKEGRALYSNDASYPMVSMSQSKAFASTSSGISKGDFLGSYNREGLPLASDGVGKSCGKSTAPFGYNEYSQAPHFDSARDRELRWKDMASYQHGQLSPNRIECEGYIYPPKLGRMERDKPEYLSDELYRKPPPSTQMDYALRDSSKQSIMDRIVVSVDKTENFQRNLRGTSLWDHCTLHENPVSDNLNASRTSPATSHDGEFFGSRSMNIDFGKRVSQNHEILPAAQSHGFRREAGPGCYGERLKSSPMTNYGPKMNGLDVNHRERLTAEELGIYDQSKRIHKRKYSVDEEMSRHKSRSTNFKTSDEFNSLNDIDEEWTDEDMGNFSLPEELGSSYSHYRKARRTFDGTAHHRISTSDDRLDSHYGKARRTFDGTAHHRISASDDRLPRIQGRLTEFPKPGGINIKRRLRPAPQKVRNPYPFDRRHDFQKSFKFWKRSQHDYHGAIHIPEGDSSEGLVAPLKSDPPEDSEEFKPLVCKAFFKFIKQLNETPAQRRRYKEQMKAGLICSVCSSLLKYSKEFIDTRSLAAHAHMSLKVGLRSQHLGLHRALCVLMGWNSDVSPGSTWHPQVMPDFEALVLKEDLILWPPLIIIHNSSIANNDPHGRKVITIEALEAILRGMGFGGGKTKVCRGKPANQSIMVVKFMGTFSGLQDAERLHNYYIENKRGRAEFEQINSCSSHNARGEEMKKLQADKVELILYGYMGIAEDFDKLDFETKKRCLVKSKKEIEAIADAPLETE